MKIQRLLWYYPFNEDDLPIQAGINIAVLLSWIYFLSIGVIAYLPVELSPFLYRSDRAVRTQC